MTRYGLRALDAPPDEYTKSYHFVRAVNEMDEVKGAERTGITPPGYEDKAVYRIECEYYVLDCGIFIPFVEWCELARAANGRADGG